MSDLVIRAREFAREKHAAQLRKYTNVPYFVHLEEVAIMVDRAGMSENAIAAAWLHDVVEDQDVLSYTIYCEFGDAVGVMVAALTNEPPAPGINRQQRHEKDLFRLDNSGAEAQTIKCADLISNTSTIVKYDPGFAKVYLPEKRAVLDVLTCAHDGLRQQALDSLRQAEDDLLQNTLARVQGVEP